MSRERLPQDAVGVAGDPFGAVAARLPSDALERRRKCGGLRLHGARRGGG